MRSSLVVFFLPRGAGYRTIAEVSILEFGENETTSNRADTLIAAGSMPVSNQSTLLATAIRCFESSFDVRGNSQELVNAVFSRCRWTNDGGYR